MTLARSVTTATASIGHYSWRELGAGGSTMTVWCFPILGAGKNEASEYDDLYCDLPTELLRFVALSFHGSACYD